MTIKSYLWGMRIGTITSLAAWLLVLVYVDPNTAGAMGKILFFLSMFLVLSGMFALLLTWLRKMLGSGEVIAFAYLGMSFREGVLLALLTVALLVLQGFRVLTWWDASLVVAGVFLIELYFLTRR